MNDYCITYTSYHRRLSASHL